MKPHIRCRHGIWYCGVFSSLSGLRCMLPPYGHGHTPSDALRDWQQLQLHVEHHSV